MGSGNNISVYPTLAGSFCRALDSQHLATADIIVVLRNWNRKLTDERMSKALDLLYNKYGTALVMAESRNTWAEAYKIRRMFGDSIKSLIIVTHRDHHYRAFLTFIQALPGVRIVSAPVDSPQDPVEFDKIQEYQKKGDVASYEHGLERLR